MVSKLYILVWAEGFHRNYTDLVLGNRSQGELMFGKKFLSYVYMCWCWQRGQFYRRGLLICMRIENSERFPSFGGWC